MAKKKIWTRGSSWTHSDERLEHHLLGRVGDAVRRPLWTIMASAQVLLKSRNLTARDARHVDRIDASAHRLASVLRDLFDLALADAGVAMPLSRGSADMRRLAKEAITEARIDHPGRWIAHASGGDGAGDWDHERVIQLLSNLLTHALERSSDATPVSFAWWGEEHEVLVEVEYQPDEERARRPMQLGLGIARLIARAHGGDMEVSEGAPGIVLTAVLPRHGALPGREELGRIRQRPALEEAREA